jgi:hypothetical protein
MKGLGTTYVVWGIVYETRRERAACVGGLS